MRFRSLITALLTAFVLLASASLAGAHETYKVKRGDTLSQIAAAHGTSWPKLHKLNAATVSNPHLIFPGQVLALAPAPDTAASKSSRKTSAPKRGDSTAAAQPGTVRPATGAVTSKYGMRTHPITGVYKLHTGTDYAVGDGKAYAAKAGKVSVEHPGWAGNLVVIDHGGGVVTRYAHLASVSVKPGQQVSAGAVVGRIGARGLATGAHLHFEVLINGEFVNPASWLKQ